MNGLWGGEMMINYHQRKCTLLAVTFTALILMVSMTFAADSTAPLTVPSPVMGTYSKSQSVTLACDDSTGSGCAGTYYCLGKGCLPTTAYSEPIVIGSSATLNFQSLDVEGNIEQVKSYDYTIDIGLAYQFEGLWPQLPQPQYFSPMRMAADTKGNIYIADGANHRIQKFDANGFFLAQWGIKGQGNGQFDTPSGVAVDNVGNIYVADTNNNRIQKFDGNGIYLAQWGSAGTGNGNFDHPLSLVVDSNNHLFVAESHRIQKFSSNGTFISTWGTAGPATGQFQSLRGVTVDSSGNVYTTEMNRIQKFNTDGIFLATWGRSGISDGQISYADGIVVDTNGDVLIADSLNYRVQKFSASGTFIGKWGTKGLGDGQFGGGPVGIAMGVDGRFYVSDPVDKRIQVFSHEGVFLGKWHSDGADSGEFNDPEGVAIDLAGNVYVTDYGNNRVQKFDNNGTFLLQWGGSGSGNGQFSMPSGVAVDTAGNVFVVDKGNYRVQKFDSNGNYLGQWGQNGYANGEFSEANGIAVDTSGNVFVTDLYWGRVQKFDNNGNYLTQWDRGETYYTFNAPAGVAVDGGGNVYVLDTREQLVQKFTNDGGYLTRWGSYGLDNGQFAFPKGIAADAAGGIYVTDTKNPYEVYTGNSKRVQKFDSNGTYLTQWGMAGTGNGQFNNLTGIAVNTSGSYVYVADSVNNRLQKFSSLIAAPPLAVTVRASVIAGNGTITSTNPVYKNAGETATFILSPSTGSQLVPTAIGTCPAGSFSGNSYTTGVITGDCTVDFSFTDVVPPDTTITSFPANPTTSTAFTFTFVASEPGSTFECSLDNGGWRTCSSPYSNGIVYAQCLDCRIDRAMTFAVRAKDSGGNEDPTPATYSWTIINPFTSSFDNVMDGGVVNLQAMDYYSGDLALARSISFTIRGGWDSAYVTSGGQTRIHGTVIISAGSVTVEDITIM